jgi:hypothetical protein
MTWSSLAKLSGVKGEPTSSDANDSFDGLVLITGGGLVKRIVLADKSHRLGTDGIKGPFLMGRLRG